MILSKIKFAEFVGVSRAAVYKAIDSNKIPCRRDGKIDTKHADVVVYVAKHNGGRKKQPDPKKFKNPKALTKAQIDKKTSKPKKSKPEPKQGKLYRSPHSEDDSQPPEKPKKETPLDGVDKNEADRLKVIEEIRYKRVKTAMEREDLIPRKFISVIFSKLSMIDTNEFLTLGSNMGAEIAGMFGITDSKKVIKVSKYIEKKLYRILKHRKSLINKQLKKYKSQIETDGNSTNNKI